MSSEGLRVPVLPFCSFSVFLWLVDHHRRRSFISKRRQQSQWISARLLYMRRLEHSINVHVSFLHVSHRSSIMNLLFFSRINAVSNSQVRGEAMTEGVLGTRGTRQFLCTFLFFFLREADCRRTVVAITGFRRRIRFPHRINLDSFRRFRRDDICKPMARCGFISSEFLDLHCVLGLQIRANRGSLGLAS